MQETQHPRTQLAWTRTGLALLVVGLVEVRLVLGPDPSVALWTLGGLLGAFLLVGVLAAGRLRRNVDALGVGHVSTGGRAPAVVAALTVVVGLLGAVAILFQEHLIQF